MTALFLRNAGKELSEQRRLLTQRIERQAAILSDLIDALDVIEGDCDLERNGDEEPSLGWTKTMALGNTDDLEESLHDEASLSEQGAP